MKKLISMLSVLVLAISTLTFTSCDPENGIAPVDQWTKAEVSYEKNSISTTLNCFFFYSENEEYKGPTVNNDIKSAYQPGLTVVVVPNTESEIAYALGGNDYFIVYNLPKNTEVELKDDESDSNSFKVSMNYTIYSGLCLAKTELIKNASSTADSALTTKSKSSVDLATIKEKFTWKTLLKSILNDYL